MRSFPYLRECHCRVIDIFSVECIELLEIPRGGVVRSIDGRQFSASSCPLSTFIALMLDPGAEVVLFSVGDLAIEVLIEGVIENLGLLLVGWSGRSIGGNFGEGELVLGASECSIFFGVAPGLLLEHNKIMAQYNHHCPCAFSCKAAMRCFTLASAECRYLYFTTNSLHFYMSWLWKKSYRSCCSPLRTPSRRRLISSAWGRVAFSML